VRVFLVMAGVECLVSKEVERAGRSGREGGKEGGRVDTASFSVRCEVQTARSRYVHAVGEQRVLL